MKEAKGSFKRISFGISDVPDRKELLQSSKGVNSYRVPLKRLKAGAGSLRFLSQGRSEAPQSRHGLPAIYRIYRRADRIALGGIRFYRKNISPARAAKCPYYPTCSTYGLQAVEKYGAIKGLMLAFWRILRCNPFSRGGYDPIP